MRYKGLNFKDPITLLKRKKGNLSLTRTSPANDNQGNTYQANVGRFQNGLAVEEATTNLFTSALSLSFNQAWTSGTLNGTYTISINAGTGSITLSGGATGTVNAGGYLVFTVTNATVTFTPSGNPELNQLENKAYPTTFQIGGTPRTQEQCLLPSNAIIDPTDCTIEIEYYFTNATLINDTKSHYLFLAASDGAFSKNLMSIRYTPVSPNYLRMGLSNSETALLYNCKSLNYHLHNVPAPGRHKLTMSWGKTGWGTTEFVGYYDGNRVASPLVDPPLPSVASALRINHMLDLMGKGYISNITITHGKRNEQDCINRGNPDIQGFKIDKHVSFAASLTKDLSYYTFKNPIRVNKAKAGIPYCVLTLDDGLSSQYTNAFPYLVEKDIPATFFVNGSGIGTAGKISLSQLSEIEENNGVAANHAYSHTDLSTLTLEQQNQLIADQNTWAENNGFTKGEKCIAYPYGRWNRDTITAMKNNDIVLGRTTNAGSQYVPINPASKWYGLNCYMLSLTSNITDALTFLDQSKARGDTAIFLVHGVEPNPTVDDQISITQFTTLIDGIVASGVRCLSMPDWYNLVK